MKDQMTHAESANKLAELAEDNERLRTLISDLKAAIPERRSLPTTRVFLSGPMSGLPESNYPAFRAEAERLRALGYHVESPAENDPPACGTWHGYMRKAVEQLITCDVIALLPGWSESRGSLMERQLAVTLGMSAIQAHKIQPLKKVLDTCEQRS